MMRSLRKVVSKGSLRRGIAYLLTFCVLLNTSLPAAFALDVGDMTSNNGLVGPITWGDHTIIDTANGAIIDWSNFNTTDTSALPTGVRQSVAFNQYDALGGSLSSSSAVLNRITSVGPTQFDGALTGNGRVFVVNPAGVFFGGTATVNVTQLVASGLNILNFDAIADGTATEMVFQGGDGVAENWGVIEAADSIHLVGRRAVNRRVMRATNGLIVIAGGDVGDTGSIRIAQDGSNVFVDLPVDPGGATIADVTDAENRSLISAGNGKVVIAAADTFGRAVGHAGQIIAAGGTVRMQAARINDRGPIDVHSAAYTNADGGTVELIGAQEVVVGEDKLGIPADILADGGGTGAGGNIILESAGTVTVEPGTIPHAYTGREDMLFSAKGGGTSGDGGHIKIAGDSFSIASGTQFEAGAQNPASNPGTLEIETPTVTVANGPGAGVLDTLYEEDIETVSAINGTNVVIRGTGTNTGVTVENIDDNQITGGIGGIELHATGDNGSVTFADTADSISTTRGNIAMSAGSGGINIGSLETGEASAVPGQITLTTSNGGNITAQNLAIRNGWGHAEINANASGNLTVNGNVAVGRDAPIQNVPSGANAEAIVNLSAGNHVVLEGAVTASSHGANTAAMGGLTKSYVGIFGDTNTNGTGNVTINGNLSAYAISAEGGNSNATVEVGTPNNVIFGPGVAMPLADADSGEAHVESYTSIRAEVSGDVAEIIISQALVQGLPDFGATHMGSPLAGNVLDNDGLDNPSASLGTGPGHAASFTLNPDGSYSYTPEAGYVGDDMFTYTATVDGSTSGPITVTITMSNTLPVLANDAATTYQQTAVAGNVLANDSDADGDPLTSSLVSGPANASAFQLNADGSFSYTPKKDFIGQDSFTYSANDPQAGATPGQATVTITVAQGPPPPSTKAPPAAPGVDLRIQPEISGTPALVKWVAVEIGVSERMVDVWFANTLASARDIAPFNSYSNFKKAARILQDPRGIHTSALSQVIDEFASSTAPPTEEQMASIAEAISGSAEPGSVYALAGAYVSSLEDYVTFLVGEMGFSQGDAIALATTKYVEQLAEKQSVGLAAYVAAELAGIFTDSLD